MEMEMESGEYKKSSQNMDLQTSSSYAKWDPMTEESYSFFNTVGNFDPTSMITGERELKITEQPCKFYTGEGDTCNRKPCSYNHDKIYVQARLANNTKIKPKQLVEILLVEDLKPQLPAPDGIMNVGLLGCVSSPEEFYIIPYGDWSCACTKKTIDDCKEGAEDFTGVRSLTTMWKDLDYFTSHPHDRSNTLILNQLVAVKISTTGKTKQWFRAAVLEDVLLGDSIQFPRASLRLIDFGTLITANIKDIIPLPKALLRYPPLGYRCALYGVSPLRHDWSTKANDLFRFLAHGQECLFVIKQSNSSLDSGFVLDSTPYLVDLHVKFEGKYVNIGHVLEEKGYALAWHPYPTRPFLLKHIPDPKGFTNLFTPMGDFHSKLVEIPEEVQRREDERLSKYLNRIPLQTKGLLLNPDSNKSGKPTGLKALN